MGVGIMDAFSDLLEPYSSQIASVAGFVTCLQFFSGFILLNDIRKRGSSDIFPPDPFLGGIVLSILTLKLGTLMGDSAMIKVNIIGFAVGVISMTVFYWYASNERKSKLWVKIGITGAIIAALLAYTNFEDPAKVEFRLSMILTTILVYLVGSPLLNLGEIMRKKSTEGLPFPLIFTGSLVTTLWALYGVSIRNHSMAYQNMFLGFLSYIQLALFVIYPNTPSTPTSKSASPDKKKGDKYKKLE